MLDLHKFTVAISRVIEVHHDGHGGAAPDAMTWDKGSIIKSQASSPRVIIDQTSVAGPPGLQDSSWCSLSLTPITQEDAAVWPYSVNILLEFTSFMATLHWPQCAAQLGKIRFFFSGTACYV